MYTYISDDTLENAMNFMWRIRCEFRGCIGQESGHTFSVVHSILFYFYSFSFPSFTCRDDSCSDQSEKGLGTT